MPDGSAAAIYSPAMPYAFEVDRARSRLRIVGSDPVGLADVLALLDRQISEGAWAYGTLHDARLVTWLPTEEDIRVIIAFVDHTSKTLGPRGPVAFVAAPHALVGIARMYAQIGEGSTLHAEVFRDIDAAARWLDTASQHRA